MSCLRSTGILLSKLSLVEGPSLTGPLVQVVRGIKPRWLPKSKSKIFYVRTPTPRNQEESEELRTMYFHYRTRIRAIRKFLMVQQKQKLRVIHEHAASEDRDSAAELQSMENIVSQWNSRVEAVRVEEWANEKERQEDRSRKWMERDQSRLQRRQQIAQDKFLQNLEDSKSFITLDNLDTQIEKLLNVRQDYNFAIDKQGNKLSESDSSSRTDDEQGADSPGHEDSVKN